VPIATTPDQLALHAESTAGGEFLLARCLSVAGECTIGLRQARVEEILGGPDCVRDLHRLAVAGAHRD